MPINNALYLRRRKRVALPETTAPNGELLPTPYVASILKNIESLGYTFSEALFAACRTLSLKQLVAFYNELIPDLQLLRGAHRTFRPMYPNFPEQVMTMDEGQLYFNALVHYWSGGKLFPYTNPQKRPELSEDEGEPTRIDLGSSEEFETLFAQIAGANASLSEQDKEDLTWFAETYGNSIGLLLPTAIPQKENLAFVAGLLLNHTDREQATAFISTFCRTATDVLRLAVAMSDGDVSLAEATRFRTFSRPERALLLTLIEEQANVTEDMLRWKKRWIRLGEKLHPGEFAHRYPNAARAFSVLRNDEPFTTFNSEIEQDLAEKRVSEAVTRLSTRPGDFARRLDHLLRLDAERQGTVIGAFAAAASRVSTPVLLQLRQHFLIRNERPGLRVFFPKGNVAKAQSMENTLPLLPEETCRGVVSACEAALTTRFAALPSLGKVYIDPSLRDYMAPFAMRSSSKSLRTLVRGSRLPLPEGDTLRFFVWWKNGTDRTDIDLSATLFAPDFKYVDILSYYNLKGFGGVHSGDIVDAPEGASEFIDVSLEKIRNAGVRYIVMTLNSYTQQPYVDLPECFAGWMARKEAGSGEVFEPRTVRDRLDLTADTRIAVPLVLDVIGHQVIWCDMALRSNPLWVNNVHGNLSGVVATLRAMVDLKKPNLYDLFVLHTRARGEQVDRPEEADTVFSVATETPFRLEEIASQYMA